jgi:uncharacterized protein YciI
MGFVILAFDGPDPARRAGSMARHLEVLPGWVADGRVTFAVPLLGPDGLGRGSLIVLAGERVEADAYLAAEPFAAEGVWAAISVYPFRIAPLPYRPLPRPGAPLAPARTHTVIVAWDGTDIEAPARRQAVRAAHMDRVGPQAASGMLTMGGALLGDDGAMRGSIAVIAQASDDAARAWLGQDPYVVGDVWRDIALHGTRLFPLPFHRLPGEAA